MTMTARDPVTRISLEQKMKVRKWEILEATKVKISRREKKASRNIYDISSIKHVTRKFHVVVVQKKAKKRTKKCATRAKLVFFC